MCGIIGYTGVEPAAPILLEGLERLEYRGYDSAGLAFSGGLRVRAAGRLENLRRAMAQFSEEAQTCCCGIGHTRWATHGAPTEQNAHPHRSARGGYTVAHNGIIENYEALRARLQGEGVEFSTQTDTEVIAQLLEFHDTSDPLATMRVVLSQLEGSYALAVLYDKLPDQIWCARYRSQLLACVSGQGALLASDAAALLPHCRSLYRLEDGEMGLLRREGISFFDGCGREIRKGASPVARHVSAASKEGYEHFMRKEMDEQAAAVRLTLEPLLRGDTLDLGGAEAPLQCAHEIDRVLFLGCGSAWHVGMAGRAVAEELAGIPAAAELASEFRHQSVTVNRNTLVVVISQSGETADTLMALRLAKQAGARTLGVVNVECSSIALECGSVLYTKAGLEVAVATTKAYSAQLAAVYAIAARLGQLRGRLGTQELREFCHALAALPSQIEETMRLASPVALAWAEEMHHKEHAYFIGRSIDYAAALEGSLKLKEISYIHAEAYAAGELKHGAISLIEPGTPVVAVCMRPKVAAKTRANMEEARARGAHVYCVTSDPSVTARRRVLLPAAHPLLCASLSVLPLQLLAYHCARLRGCDIDKPRSLAKSVTVE